MGRPGLNTTSWGYHGDTGHKYHKPDEFGPRYPGLKYAIPYTKGNTVGCGINMQTAKLFFTINGFNLGKQDLFRMKAVLTMVLRRSILQRDRDVVSHRWDWGERV